MKALNNSKWNQGLEGITTVIVVPSDLTIVDKLYVAGGFGSEFITDLFR
ncbi:hypothetical protein JOC34_001531 [Virgibacillus halotolerans]|nr:hypothetical protein [Virgibacillus halotolerans]